MRNTPAGFVVLALFTLASAGITPEDARACVAVGRAGPVAVHGEEAMIVWDAAHRTEHFVRRAGFRGVRRDFGFLVPTPSRPELQEVASGFFGTLARFYLAVPDTFEGVRGVGSRGGAPRAAAARVEVVEQRRLAGMEATVLAARDPDALAGWLARHRYPASPALTRWLAPYVAHGFLITAFRVDPSGGPSTFETASVRMSFTTDRPFFPYSEPSPGAPRPFRVSVIAPTPVRAVLAPPGEGGGSPWPVPVGFAGAPIGLGTLETTVPTGTIPHGSWLTTFDEPRSVRGALDIFFDPDPSAAPVPSTIRARLVP